MKRLSVLLALACVSIGCGKSEEPSAVTSTDGTVTTETVTAEKLPVFTLFWSEYPSWSAIAAAEELGLIDGREGYVGPIETKWNVDIDLREADYDTCVTTLSQGTANASCLTNIDGIIPAISNNVVAVLATSTSNGADSWIVPAGSTWETLKGKPTYGLEKSVAQYCFVRNLELAGKSIEDYPFKQMDPAAAAQAMQQSQPGIDSIQVWEPFVLQTLKSRPDAIRFNDSTKIPEEIVDMVLLTKSTTESEGGAAFAHAIIDTFNSVEALKEDAKTRNSTLTAISTKFGKLSVEDMEVIVDRCSFYSAERSAALFAKASFQNNCTVVVPKTSTKAGILPPEALDVKISFTDATADMYFDASYLQTVLGKTAAE